MDVRERLKMLMEDKSNLIKGEAEIEELGTVYFRALPASYVYKTLPSAKELEEIQAKQNNEEADETSSEKMPYEDVLDAIKRSVCDEKGELLFDDDTSEVLDLISIKSVMELVNNVFKFSAMTKESEEEIEKNLDPVA